MNKSRGFGLLDLMVTVAVAAMLFVLAIPAYEMFVQRAKVAKAIGDLGVISIAIETFRLNNNDRVPDALGDLPIELPMDPWDRSYQFLNIQAAGPGLGALRKDGKLNPLNTDFDLYSQGNDGLTKGPLSAKDSKDDIIRANNGAFFGLAEDY